MTSLTWLKVLVAPARLLPKPQRGGVAFAALTLGIGLDRSESFNAAWSFAVNWVKTLPDVLTLGQVMTELGTPQLYEREWVHVNGRPPVEAMVTWMRRAIHNGPGTAFSIGVSIGEMGIWRHCFRELSEAKPLLDELQTFLEQAEFEDADVWLSAMPAATLGGAPLRPLSAD